MPWTPDDEIEKLRQTLLDHAKQRDADAEMVRQVVDAGYKALATKLHPDKGGSTEEMARLNRVRGLVKTQYAPTTPRRQKKEKPSLDFTPQELDELRHSLAEICTLTKFVQGKVHGGTNVRCKTLTDRLDLIREAAHSAKTLVLKVEIRNPKKGV